MKRESGERRVDRREGGREKGGKVGKRKCILLIEHVEFGLLMKLSKYSPNNN